MVAKLMQSTGLKCRCADTRSAWNAERWAAWSTQEMLTAGKRDSWTALHRPAGRAWRYQSTHSLTVPSRS